MAFRHFHLHLAILCLHPTDPFLWFRNLGLDTSLGRQDHCFWQHLPLMYSSDSVHDECWCTTPSRLSTATAVADPGETALFLRAHSKDGRLTGYTQSPTYVDPQVPQGLEAPPRSHLAQDHWSWPPATQPWIDFSTETGRRPRTVEAAHGDGYASVGGMPMMMMSVYVCLTVDQWSWDVRV